MGFFDFLRPKAESESPGLSSFTVIRSMADLTLPKVDVDRLSVFLEEQVRMHAAAKSTPTEGDVFTAQELIDLMHEAPVYFYGFFDWKEASQELNTYLRNAMKRNFDLDLSDTPVCNLNDLPSIDQVYQRYGTELQKHQITLCHVDIDSDSYQVMLIRTADYPPLTELVKTMGYQVKHFVEQW